MRPRCSRAGRARRRAERPRLASSAPKQDFSPGGWGKPGRGQGDDRSRSYRSVGAAATCCSNWRRRALSQAGDAGCRRAGADAVARRASIWRRRSTDHGWRRMAVALRLTARQVDRKRVERRIRAMGSKRWAQSRRPAAPRSSTGPSPYLLRGLAIGRTKSGLPASPTSGWPAVAAIGKTQRPQRRHEISFSIISKTP